LIGFCEKWWITAARAIAAIVFGSLVLLWSGLDIGGFTALFGIFALVDGVLLLGLGVVARDVLEAWWLVVLEGALGAGIGVLALSWPHIRGLTLLWLLALWAVLTGVAEIEAGIRLRRLAEGEASLLVAGAISLIAGIVLIAVPAEDALELRWAVGVFGLVYGAALLLVAVRLSRVAARARRGEIGQRPRTSSVVGASPETTQDGSDREGRA
jgi:uncharacterized membrane protein HdeD (DUF308 family)